MVGAGRRGHTLLISGDVRVEEYALKKKNHARARTHTDKCRVSPALSGKWIVIKGRNVNTPGPDPPPPPFPSPAPLKTLTNECRLHLGGIQGLSATGPGVLMELGRGGSGAGRHQGGTGAWRGGEALAFRGGAGQADTLQIGCNVRGNLAFLPQGSGCPAGRSFSLLVKMQEKRVK